MHTFIITEVIKIMRWKTLLEVCVFNIFKFPLYDIIALRCHCTRKYTNEILFAERIYCNCVHVCKRDTQQLIKVSWHLSFCQPELIMITLAHYTGISPRFQIYCIKSTNASFPNHWNVSSFGAKTSFCNCHNGNNLLNISP